jgi:hypothetical protein
MFVVDDLPQTLAYTLLVNVDAKPSTPYIVGTQNHPYCTCSMARFPMIPMIVVVGLAQPTADLSLV